MGSYLRNEFVSLRAIEPEDVELLYEWENDSEVWKVSNALAPLSRYILAMYIKNSDKDIYETRQLRFMIDNSEGKTVGAIDIFDFDPHSMRAGIGILIYRKKDRVNGYASQALQLLIYYCFGRLGLHQLYAGVSEGNSASLKLFQRFGFKVSGTKRDWLRTSSGWGSEIFLQLINED